MQEVFRQWHAFNSPSGHFLFVIENTYVNSNTAYPCVCIHDLKKFLDDFVCVITSHDYAVITLRINHKFFVTI